MTPKPLYFQDDATTPAAWVCSKCNVLYGDLALATHCCDPKRCRDCRAVRALPKGLSCAECEAKRKARERESGRRASKAWRALPNRQPVSAYEGSIANDESGDGYHDDLAYMMDWCLDGGPHPSTLRLYATKEICPAWTASDLADDLVEQMTEAAYEDWEFHDREEMERLLEPVAELMNAQYFGYEEDRSRPLDFDLPWPPPPSESSERERVIHPIGAVMLNAEGKVFAAKRAPHKAAGGLWEFPGGKPEAGESNEQALTRELREEFGIEPEVGAWITRSILIDADPSNDGYLRIELDLYFARWTAGEFGLTDHSEAGWFTCEELRALEWCPADERVLDRVIRTIEEQEP